MTEPKVFKRGRRTYTRVGAHKEVRIDGPAKEEAAPATVTVDVAPEADQPIYVNSAMVHRSPDEIILDLAFAAPNRPRPRVRSRIAMSPRLAVRLSRLLAKAAEEE